MRLFAGLEVGDEVRARLDEGVAPLRLAHRALRWTPPSQWHLTVAFLGEVTEPLDAVTSALSPVAAHAPPAIQLELAEAGRFGNRVLWVGVDDDPAEAVAALGSSAQSALQAAGLPVDEKPVRPHLTLARGGRRRGGSGRISQRLVDAVPAVDADWTVTDLVVFASVPQGHGEPNSYEPQARIPLGA
jgi:RNA 2',3'-cyclic 3'-phosphodiesterase